MIVCAYYTKNTPYEKIILNLEKSLISLGLEYKFMGYESRGSWVANCAIKPGFILQCLEETGDEVLYVDADAVIRKKPDIVFDEAVAVCYKNHEDGRRQLMSGTIFVKQAGRSVIETWAEEQRRRPTVWDQETLDCVIKRDSVPVCVLPQGYTKIFDNGWERGQETTVYIEHFQASRKNKGKVNQAGGVKK